MNDWIYSPFVNVAILHDDAKSPNEVKLIKLEFGEPKIAAVNWIPLSAPVVSVQYFMDAKLCYAVKVLRTPRSVYFVPAL